jgi:hypothetical protein
MDVEFYFDISSPWCWITTRWLSDVATQRDVQISWKPFSLALKNGELGGDDPSGHSDAHLTAHRLMRVIASAEASEGSNVLGELYTALGKRWHLDGAPASDILDQALEELRLPKTLAAAADDPSQDDVLQRSLDEAIKIVGDDVGVPLIIFDTPENGKQGFFGPVLSQLPSAGEGLKLWDGLATMATFPHFYELKRTRHEDPDVQSTARVL